MKQNNQYLWQVCEIAPLYHHTKASNIDSPGPRNAPVPVEPPDGYQLHSWQPNPYSMGTVIICWVRLAPSAASTALSQLPPALTGPIVDAVKRWVLKNYAG